MSVPHVASNRTRINVSPEVGQHCLFRHHETGVGHACVIVRQGNRPGRVLITYPTTSGRYADGSRRHGWIRPRSVPIDDLYLATPNDCKELREYIKEHGSPYPT